MVAQIRCLSSNLEEQFPGISLEKLALSQNIPYHTFSGRHLCELPHRRPDYSLREVAYQLQFSLGEALAWSPVTWGSSNQKSTLVPVAPKPHTVQ